MRGKWFCSLTAGLAVFLFATGFAVGSEVHLITPQNPGRLVSHISLSAETFNPSQEEEVGLYYQLNDKASVTVRVYDPDFELVTTLADAEDQEKGQQGLVWSGKDLDGEIVPDEAYFFTLSAEDARGNREIYDPVVFSGGVEQDLTKASINPQGGTLEYRLQEMSRVRIRLGISGGPLLFTLVDWEPRPAGRVTEYWDGRDQDDLIELRESPRFKMIITAMSLPESSVITFGNKQQSYLDYKQGLKRPGKKNWVAFEDCSRDVSMHFTLPRRLDRSPELKMSFPNKAGSQKGVPVLQGKSVVHVALNKEAKPYFQEMKYEICFFLDQEFYAEEETGYSPYNWIWDTSQVEPGTYVLTVNLSSFKDQIGVLSKRVKIERR